MYKKEFGKNIKRYRQKAELSQSELGKMLGTTKQNISSWEKDRTQPSAGDLEKMSAIFNCSISQLIEDGGSLADFILNAPSTQQVMFQEYYKCKEADFIAKAYLQAPEPIKEAVCKLLDVDRAFFSIDKFKKGDEEQ